MRALGKIQGLHGIWPGPAVCCWSHSDIPGCLGSLMLAQSHWCMWSSPQDWQNVMRWGWLIWPMQGLILPTDPECLLGGCICCGKHRTAAVKACKPVHGICNVIAKPSPPPWSWVQRAVKQMISAPGATRSWRSTTPYTTVAFIIAPLSVIAPLSPEVPVQVFWFLVMSHCTDLRRVLVGQARVQATCQSASLGPWRGRS